MGAKVRLELSGKMLGPIFPSLHLGFVVIIWASSQMSSLELHLTGFIHSHWCSCREVNRLGLSSFLKPSHKPPLPVHSSCSCLKNQHRVCNANFSVACPLRPELEWPLSVLLAEPGKMFPRSPYWNGTSKRLSLSYSVAPLIEHFKTICVVMLCNFSCCLFYFPSSECVR